MTPNKTLNRTEDTKARAYTNCKLSLFSFPLRPQSFLLSLSFPPSPSFPIPFI